MLRELKLLGALLWLHAEIVFEVEGELARLDALLGLVNLIHFCLGSHRLTQRVVLLLMHFHDIEANDLEDVSGSPGGVPDPQLTLGHQLMPSFIDWRSYVVVFSNEIVICLLLL